MGRKTINMDMFDELRQKQSTVIAVMNNKGGCGKTTISMALGMYLARTGKNVLFWDYDPQCNLTQRLGLPDDQQKTMRLNYLFKNAETKPNLSLSVVYPYLQRLHGTSNHSGKIGMLAGSHDAENAANYLDTSLRSPDARANIGCKSIYTYVSDWVEFYKQYYDYIIIDTAPALEGNILNKIAVRASDEIICPIDGLEAAHGVKEVLGWLDSQIASKDKKPNGLFAMVKYQLDTKHVNTTTSTDARLRNSVYRTLKEVFGTFVCDNGVRELRSTRHIIPGFGGKTQYTTLCKEMIDKISVSGSENLFEFIANNGALAELESKLAVLEAKVRRRKPNFKTTKYLSKPITQTTFNPSEEATVNEQVIGTGTSI